MGGYFSSLSIVWDKCQREKEKYREAKRDEGKEEKERRGKTLLSFN